MRILILGHTLSHHSHLQFSLTAWSALDELTTYHSMSELVQVFHTETSTANFLIHPASPPHNMVFIRTSLFCSPSNRLCRPTCYLIWCNLPASVSQMLELPMWNALPKYITQFWSCHTWHRTHQWSLLPLESSPDLIHSFKYLCSLIYTLNFEYLMLY